MLTRPGLASTAGVPVIDLTPFRLGNEADKRAVAAQFADAFENIGFATITGHGVDPALIAETYDTAHAFFRLPLDQKKKSAEAGPHKKDGYIPVGSESVAATLGKRQPPDLCEALVFSGMRFERQPPQNDVERQYARPNLWPAEPVGLRPVFTDYYWAVDRLLGVLMRASALALNLPENWFDRFYDRHNCTFRIVLYPEQADDPLPGQLRNGAHRDYGGLTILRKDNADGGLQVCLPSGEWIDVNAPDDAFIINVGDLIARWTNDRWLSTLHRVVNPPRTSLNSRRLSLVMFTGPNYDAEISCIPTCTSAGNPPKYPAVRAIDHTLQKVKQHMVAAEAAAE